MRACAYEAHEQEHHAQEKDHEKEQERTRKGAGKEQERHEKDRNGSMYRSGSGSRRRSRNRGKSRKRAGASEGARARAGWGEDGEPPYGTLFGLFRAGFSPRRGGGLPRNLLYLLVCYSALGRSLSSRCAAAVATLATRRHFDSAWRLARWLRSATAGERLRRRWPPCRS